MKKVTLALTLALATTASLAGELENKLTNLGMTNIDIQTTPLAGIKAAITDQGVFYVSDNGDYVLQGDLIKIKPNGDFENLKEKLLLGKLNAMEKEMIIYPAKQQKYVATVFMDITCHYCHLLFQQIKEYNELGITLRFLAFPRAGLGAKTAQQMEAIWTAQDRNEALNKAENGELPKKLVKANVVAKQYALGLQYGVQGTPTIVTDTGTVLGGYLKPKELLKALESEH
ncbi:bifunctional protein-disulfide isomerase/oxidoreductase DsbC [Spirabiliibacterium falconis]|uniref:bifunctional protein-disulfide isomerase/oxidoreductase DsbC n=1 Tax=Spirabiliibacterium falconis TaxID=572023 RepID=UPI001AACB9E5|nr:bifunctional protein-disulfide isomerase/oxidoreductase DsbC [Spirabiliibacterium falconis]MBE2894392.1 bifunctional protein-disulfide isomerase/oxidoreductase DsbC [Spirabiliibacterium falconis]